MKLKELAEIIERFAPTEYYEDEDNSGIQVDTGRDITKVLVCLEMNDDILKEAVDKGAELIITHHPLIFYPISRVDQNEPVGRYIKAAISNGISVYSSHLAFDNAVNGNNMYLAKLLKLQDVAVPEDWCGYDEDYDEDDEQEELFSESVYENGVIGRADDGNFDLEDLIIEFLEGDEFEYDLDDPGSIGYLPKTMTFDEVCLYVERCLDLPQHYIRAIDGGCQEISKVAFCTGAGGDFGRTAVKEGCQLLITGDVKFHEAQYAKAMGLSVIDAGHYGTEKIFTENFASQLRSRTLGEIEVLEAGSNTNPYVL